MQNGAPGELCFPQAVLCVGTNWFGYGPALLLTTQAGSLAGGRMPGFWLRSRLAPYPYWLALTLWPQ